MDSSPRFSWRTYLAVRRGRGLAWSRLGPNEARILFDTAAAASASLVAAGLARLAGRGLTVRELVACAVAPALLLGANLAQGLYTWRRASPVRERLPRLAVAVVVAGFGALIISQRAFVPVAWTMFAIVPVLLARWMAYAARSAPAPLRMIVTDPHAPVAVLGGAGYIGSLTVEALLARGTRVRVLDRLMYGSRALDDFVGRPDFELIQGDVTDIARLAEALNGCRAVVHLAGLVGDPACAVDEEYTAHTNVVATRMAHEVAHSLGISRFIFASSCSVYGLADGEVHEGSALNPVSLYARTKIDSERELLRASPDNFFVTILRFATVFGHSRRPRFDLVANLMTAHAMTQGRIRAYGPQQWRPFVHTRDLARAIVLCLEAPPLVMQGQIFNVGDSRLNRTILDLARIVQSTASAYRPVTIDVEELPTDDRRNYVVSFSNIRQLLGFEASVSLESGIGEMAANLAAGAYRDYQDEIYSNAATTRRTAEDFHDPKEQSRLYGPLGRSHVESL